MLARARARTAPGKTTLLAALAGLTPLTGGPDPRSAGSRLDDAETRHVRRGRRSRPVGVVFQDYRLFPHLSVLDNVAFSPRARGLGRAPARASRRRLAGPARPRRPRRPPARRAVRRPGPAGGARPARWPATRRCCCSTSRWPRSTPAPASTCRPSCSGTSPTSPGRACWSPTTRSRRWCWPTGCSSSRTAGSCRRARRREVARRPATEYVARLVGLNLYAGTRRRRPRRCSTEAARFVRARPRRARRRCSWRCARRPWWSAPQQPGRSQRAQHLAGDDRRARPCSPTGCGSTSTGEPSALVDVTPAAVAELGLVPASGSGCRPRRPSSRSTARATRPSRWTRRTGSPAGVGRPAQAVLGVAVLWHHHPRRPPPSRRRTRAGAVTPSAGRPRRGARGDRAGAASGHVQLDRLGRQVVDAGGQGLLAAVPRRGQGQRGDDGEHGHAGADPEARR